jgi:hypothetical protein
VGGNITLMNENEFTRRGGNDEAFKAINELFIPTDLYVLCTKSENIMENIPMNIYEIDFDSIDISELTIKINTPDSYFNQNKDSVFNLEKLVSLSEYVVYNDAELALSIFIAFKELMPK